MTRALGPDQPQPAAGEGRPARALARRLLLDRYAQKLRARRATITRLAQAYREVFTRRDRL